MEIRTEHVNRQDDFNQFLDSLMVNYRISKDKDKILETYWEALGDIYSLMSGDEVKELKKKLLFNLDWMPKIKELKDHINQILRFQEKKTPIKEPVAIHSPESVGYRELTIDEAKFRMKEILYEKCKVKSVDDMLDCFDLYFRGFLMEDFDFFEETMKKANGVITTNRVLGFFSSMRTKRVEPRLEKLRGSKVKVWQDLVPPDTEKERFKTMGLKLLGKNFPELEMK